MAYIVLMKVTVRTKSEGVVSFVEQGEAVKAGEVAPVLSSIQKWRPICVVVENRIGVFECRHNLLPNNVLRFNPIQIAEWLQDLLDSGVAHSQRGLEDELGIDRTRIGQFLRLMRLPVATRTQLRNRLELNEYQIRGMVAGKQSITVAAN